MNRAILLAIVGFLLAPLEGGAQDEPLSVKSIMHRDPRRFEWLPTKPLVDPGLKNLWLAALQRTDHELRLLAADSITLIRRLEITPPDAMATALTDILADDEQDPLVLRAAAGALVALDMDSAANLLFQRLETSGLDYADAVEPALGRWGHEPMLQRWQNRLEAADVAPADLMRAIQGLGNAKAQLAAKGLEALVLNNRQPAYVRWHAAESLVQIEEPSRAALAHQLVASTSLLDRLLAGTLLAGVPSPDALVILDRLAEDPEPAVAAKALNLLYGIDPRRIYHLSIGASNSPDANVRLIGARTLYHQADVAAVEHLGRLLNDPDPLIRSTVGRWLVTLATNNDLRDAVVDEARQVLTQATWRGLEQACLVLGHLDDEASADRFVDLVRHERSEVYIAAAWALRRLSIRSTLPALLTLAKEQHAWFEMRGFLDEDSMPVGEQVSQCFQMFGVLQYQEADSLLREFVPKRFHLTESARSAACWALGYIHVDDPPAGLADQFTERLNDIHSPEPEWEGVRLACAVSLGRMKSQAALPSLREHAHTESPVGQACFWAIAQMTGEAIPEATHPKEVVGPWFLSPMRLRDRVVRE